MSTPDGLNIKVRTRNGSIINDISNSVLEYQQEIMEGPVSATFALETGHGGVDDTGLRGWFKNKLGQPISAYYSGQEVFRGIVWDMELDLDGNKYKTSLDGVANVVVASYQEEDDDGGSETMYTPWVFDNNSISRWGVFEELISTSSLSIAEALLAAQRERGSRSNPYSRVPVFDTGQETNRITVTLAGGITVANSIILRPDILRYHPNHGYDSEANQRDRLGEDTNVGAEIRRVLEVIDYTSSSFPARTNGPHFQPPITAGLGGRLRGVLWPLRIEPNSSPTKKGVSGQTGAWERLVELASIPNQDGEAMELWVNSDGGVIYRKRVEEPRYEVWPPPRNITLKDHETKPLWGARPGVAKIMVPGLYPVYLPGLYEMPPGNIRYERVVMRAGDEAPGFHGTEPDEGERRAAIEANRRWIEEAERRRETDD